MNEYTPYSQQPDYPENCYQTGNTNPPKNHRGLIAVLMVLVIFLGGIGSALGLLNIHLFRKLKENAPETASFEFSGKKEPQTTPTTDDPHSISLNKPPETVDNVPQEGGLSLQEIYAKASPSVVSISCSSRKGYASGTGVVLSADGYLVTNCHVVDGAENIEVLFYDQRKLPAQLIGTDTVSDLAVLYVPATDLQPAEFGDSATLQVGDLAVAIGDPLGVELRGTMTDGIVSAINRDIVSDGRTMTLIQTNAALHSGNSGGPLLNCHGQVVGINTMKIGDYMNEAGVEGLGFAIPSATVKEIVDQLMTQGYVSGRPTLAISVEEITSFSQFYYGLPAGLYITEIEKNSDLAKKGIVPGDILLQLDDTRIISIDNLQTFLFAHEAGDTITAIIYRDGKQYSVELTLDEAK